MLIGYLLRGISLGLYAGIMPGPTQAFILTKTIKNGWKRTLPLAFVPLISDLPIALLFCLLVSTLPSEVINVIQVIGGGYLVWLGFHTWKIANAIDEMLAGEQPMGFWQTVGVNLGNPNVYVFWGAIGAPIVLTGWSLSPLIGLSFILGMYMMLVITVAFTIFVFGLTGKLSPKVKSWLLQILALAVIIFGIYQATTGVIKFLGP